MHSRPNKVAKNCDLTKSPPRYLGDVVTLSQAINLVLELYPQKATAKIGKSNIGRQYFMPPFPSVLQEKLGMIPWDTQEDAFSGTGKNS